MDRSAIPDAAFIAPDGENAAAVRDLVDAVVDVLLDRLTTAADRSPLPDEPAPDVRIPDEPRDAAAILEAVDAVVAGSMNPAHPGYVGHMDTIPTTASVLGDLVAAAINNNMLSVEMSPVLSAMEVDLVAAFAREFDLGPDAGGVLTAGGSLANLQALAVARNRAFDVHADGLATDVGVAGGGTGDERAGGDGTGGRPLVFASEVAHTSLRKATMLLGLGTDAVVPVATDADSRMDPAALADAVDAARAAGDRPFAVVATAGTTTTGNVDPIPAVRDVARACDLWLHVDAAYGGALALSPAHRHLLDGVGDADSVTFNPQKWLYVAKTCAAVLFADGDVLASDFRVGAPYTDGDGAVPDLGERSVQGTRRADVLKCWLALQHLGRSGLTALVRESDRLTAAVHEAVVERDALEPASEPETNLVCFRAAPRWADDDGLDGLNRRLREALLDAEVYCSLPTYRGSRWLRVVLLNPYTDRAVVDRLFATVDAFLERERPA